ncbi:hypothetical protein [Anaeromicropila herbilytica]|uniref:Uncharacterized protein n=1 Tax=Anaeromicropila herbilytica TaxID=2785025 RepID=A0A7R7EIW8_9FIRM|nr:hypothetical protein [Anaeromicropila herbilytica]BCN29593.1 hypothetical protein bsdtb5_08880 [Anaeromicropila herbilytica]
MIKNDTYQVEKTEINAHSIRFTVINRRPRSTDRAKEKIESELFKVFKKYCN